MGEAFCLDLALLLLLVRGVFSTLVGPRKADVANVTNADIAESIQFYPGRAIIPIFPGSATGLAPYQRL